MIRLKLSLYKLSEFFSYNVKCYFLFLFNECCLNIFCKYTCFLRYIIILKKSFVISKISLSTPNIHFYLNELIYIFHVSFSYYLLLYELIHFSMGVVYILYIFMIIYENSSKQYTYIMVIHFYFL